MKNQIIEFIRKTIRYSAGILPSTAILTCLINAYNCSNSAYFKSFFHTVNMNVILLFFCGVIISYLIIMQQSEQNQLIEDPEHPGEYLNVDACFAAPIIGIFAISDQAVSNHPYGAMIVRTSSNSDKR